MLKKFFFLASILLVAGCSSQQVSLTDDTKSVTGDVQSTGISTAQVLGVTEPTNIISETVTFSGYQGFFVKPSVDGQYPGLILIHEWRGLNDSIKDMAKVLADQGYNVLAVDMYNGVIAKSPEEARALTQTITPEFSSAILTSAETYLRTERNSSKVGVRGWCFGGAQSLQLAISSPTVDATVIYYGRLQTGADLLAKIQSPILGIFGSVDQSIPVEVVNSFESELIGQNKIVDIQMYSGVGHAFANPTGPNFAPKETVDAWNKTIEFLKKNLK